MSADSSLPAPAARGGEVRTRAALEALLSEMIQFPERRAELEQEILRNFSVTKAVLVLDMSGFSRTTRAHGIVTFLLMIFETRRLCEASVTRHGGTLVKTDADNLFCFFDEPASAVAAAREMIGRLETANCVLPDELRLYASIGIGFGPTLSVGGDDLFGDEVNLASKLGEDIAAAGEILLTTAAAAALPEAAATGTKMELSVSGLALEYWKLRV